MPNDYSSHSALTPDGEALTQFTTRGIEVFEVTFGDIETKIKQRLNSSILSATINYSIDEVTELTLKIIDRQYQSELYQNQNSNRSFAQSNYFNIGRDVTYVSKTIRNSYANPETQTATVGLVTLLMEVADVSCAQENGVSTIWTVKCRTKACQQMKRDKKAESVSGNGTDYVRAAAKKFGLKFIGENTDKKRKITKASGENEADSVWDVIQNLAQQAKFKCFEADGTLYFASMKWLMYKWGSDELRYLHQVKDATGKLGPVKEVIRRYVPIMPGEDGREFRAMTLPQMNRSDNTPMEATGSATIERTNGVSLRPGMTVFIGGIPTFTGYYLITSVDFEERSPNPVGVNFQTPERKPKEKIINLPVGPLYDNTNDAIGPDVLIPYIKYMTNQAAVPGTRRRPYT